MDQWKSLVENSSFLAVVAVVLLVTLLFLIRRRRHAAKTVPADDSSPPGGLWGMIEPYRQSHPDFFKILEMFESSHSVDQLCQDREIMEAFQRLGKATPQTADRPGSTLNLSAAVKTDQTSEAAMLTILKGIFGNPEYARELPPEAHQNLDKFLDSLTT